MVLLLLSKKQQQKQTKKDHDDGDYDAKEDEIKLLWNAEGKKRQDSKAMQAQKEEEQQQASKAINGRTTTSKSPFQFLLLFVICILLGIISTHVLVVLFRSKNNGKSSIKTNNNKNKQQKATAVAMPELTPSQQSALESMMMRLADQDEFGEQEELTTASDDDDSTTTTDASQIIENDSSHNDDKQREKEDDDNDDAPWPRIAWLMSFPNSGTSFTQHVVRFMSGMCTASNYGHEFRNATTGASVPLWKNDQEGPFLIDLERFQRPHGKVYVLTKTHCGGRCQVCHHGREYLETIHSFQRACQAGTRQYINATTGLVTKVETHVPLDRIHRLVHLIRDPFDNIVSRYHLELKKKNYTNPDSNGETFLGPNQRDFATFCTQTLVHERQSHIRDTSHYSLENDLYYQKMWDNTTRDLLQHVSCHEDFYRWIMWHNMAFILSRDLQLNVHIHYYEDYSKRYREAIMELLDFLHISIDETTVEWPKFRAGKNYHKYFSQEERYNMSLAARHLALPSTWKRVQHYFFHDDDGADKDE